MSGGEVEIERVFGVKFEIKVRRVELYIWRRKIFRDKG